MTFQGREVVGFMSERTLARLDWLISKYEVTSVIEIGAFVGLSTCYLAERVDTVTTVDTFDAKNQADPTFDPYIRPYHRDAYDNQYETFLKNTQAYPNIEHLRMTSLEAAQLDVMADMVYIDGSHSYEAAKADIEAWLPHTRKVICGDDNWDKPGMGVKQALEELGIPDSGERTWWQEV